MAGPKGPEPSFSLDVFAGALTGAAGGRGGPRAPAAIA